MPQPPFNWTCAYCGQTSTITSVNHDIGNTTFQVTRSAKSDFSLISEATYCPNPDCNKLTLNVELWENGTVDYGGATRWVAKKKLNSWPLLPRSIAKPIPTYVPEEIRNNYSEACLILNDSPKASAAMSRRCLQGILRDFWEIPHNKRGNLGAEINYIKDKVDDDVVDNIIAVREVGDIGAHMEKSVDTIVDVEPEEAALLVELIETLISDWYVARKKRQDRSEKLSQTIAKKRKDKSVAKKSAAKANTDNTVEVTDIVPKKKM